MRRIAVMIGSKSDLIQCHNGLDFLRKQVDLNNIEVVEVIVASIHRNTEEVLTITRQLVDRVDVLIVGAGWANHLTGTVDAYLRNTLKNDQLTVVGVAFSDPKEPKHTSAAILSITEVPNTKTVFRYFVGACGFKDACIYAAEGKLEPISLTNPKAVERLTLNDAIDVTQKLLKQ